MSVLHATWLEKRNSNPLSLNPYLFIWADEWNIAKPKEVRDAPLPHPFHLSIEELKNWLTTKNLLPSQCFPQTALLTLPSKSIKQKKFSIDSWSGLPLLADEPIPTQYEWWPWVIEGLALKPNDAITWLAHLPLTNQNNDFGDELLWWSHLERWILSLIAKGLWLPKVEINQCEESVGQAQWIPLISHEKERRRLEDFASRLPLVTSCGILLEEKSQDLKNKHLASHRPQENRVFVSNLLQELIDAHLRDSFTPNDKELDPLLKAWQKALGSSDGKLTLNNEELIRLSQASRNWKERISGQFQNARACLELLVPQHGKDKWRLIFSLQAEADPSLKISASTIWNTNTDFIQLGNIRVEKPGEVLLEGLGRALGIFQALEKGLENATPDSMDLEATEAFIFIRSIAKQLREIGIGVILPNSLSGGLASRLGITMQAELIQSSKNIGLGQKLSWEWKFMIGGIKLTFKELEALGRKKSPLVNYKGIWIELRPKDMENAENFCKNNPNLSLDDALRLTGSDGNTLMKLPVHHFEAGPKLQNVLERYHKQKAPEPLPAPSNFTGQLRPYQERGLGWLNFLNRFNQGACLADDMGLGKTIQVLAFIQHLKQENELNKNILLIAPTSVLTNWKREGEKFTPQLSILEHYGKDRATTISDLKKRLLKIDILITSYNLLTRDSELLEGIDWQGIIIDEAQAIKNPNAKQSKTVHRLNKKQSKKYFRIALTGTPIENKINEIWSIMHFLNPKVLGEIEFFKQRFQLPIERYGDISSQKELNVLIKPFILRRLKTDKSIISDLPEKVELNEWVNLSSEQKSLYNKTLDKALADISSSPLGQRNGKVLGLLTRLKQICNHPALLFKEANVEETFPDRSGKVQRLIELLEEILEVNDRVLIFTQFAEWGLLLQTYLQKKWQSQIPFLHGGIRKIDRQTMIDHFQNDPRGPNIFLLSLKAGGVGLNLTRASHVIHIDRWWNPAVENQATDRAYRIGQNNAVMVHKFITKGSLEEKINQMLIKKSRLAEDIIGSGEEWLGNLEIKALRELVTLDKDE